MSSSRHLPAWLRSVLVVALIYLFLVGVSSLESGIKLAGVFIVLPLIGLAIFR